MDQTTREHIIAAHSARVSGENMSRKSYLAGIRAATRTLDETSFDYATLDVIARDTRAQAYTAAHAEPFNHAETMYLYGELAAYYNAGAR